MNINSDKIYIGSPTSKCFEADVVLIPTSSGQSFIVAKNRHGRDGMKVAVHDVLDISKLTKILSEKYN